jgi:hypothetical protein
LLLLVFATHLPFFAWRWRKTGEARYAATCLTFGLLVIAYTLRVFAPDAALAGVRLHPAIRGAALASAAVSIGWLIVHQASRLRASGSPDR